MKTYEKIEIMQAFLDGHVIEFSNREGETGNFEHTTELNPVWDWWTNNYWIQAPKVDFHTVGYVNIYKGMVRNNNIYKSRGFAAINRHSDDDRIGVRVNITFKEI